jgi:hypothetical protein
LAPPTKLTSQQIGDCIVWLDYNANEISAVEQQRARQLRQALSAERNARRKAKREKREWAHAEAHKALIRELDETFIAVAMTGSPVARGGR